MKFFSKKYDIKIGVVFGGGAARGIGHVGVIKAFEQHGIKPDFICGTSVGSLVGAAWASGMGIEQMEEFALTIKTTDFIPKVRFPGVYVNSQRLEEMAIKAIGKDVEFKDLKIPFACVVLDPLKDQEVILNSGNLAKAISASCAMPLIYKPVQINDSSYVDGGWVNNIPSSVARGKHCDYIIAIDVNGGRKYGAESTGFGAMLSWSLRSAVVKNSKEGLAEADFVITPDLKKYRAMDIGKGNNQEMIKAGYDATNAVIEQLKSELENAKPLAVKLKEEYGVKKQELKQTLKEIKKRDE